MSQHHSMDAVALDPDKFKIRLENERVRVLEVQLAPGQSHAMHWHPRHLIYTLTSYRVRDTYPDGSTEEMERPAGEMLWGDELTHAAENIGDTPVHALIIELKDA